MPLIEWNETFSVNNQEIDNQHKEWVRILNTLHDIIMGDDLLAQRTAAKTALDSMYSGASQHFNLEEEYMWKINYPGLLKHRRIHRDFCTLLYNYRRDIQKGRLVLISEVISLLKNWLQHHILVEDKKYAEFSAKLLGIIKRAV